MIHAKYKLIYGKNIDQLMKNVNNFLLTIDYKQILKMETTVNENGRYCAVTYLSAEDLRDEKIENIIK